MQSTLTDLHGSQRGELIYKDVIRMMTDKATSSFHLPRSSVAVLRGIEGIVMTFSHESYIRGAIDASMSPPLLLHWRRRELRHCPNLYL